MMLWQLDACVDGWNRVHGGEEKAPAMDFDEFEREIAKHGYH